VKFLAIVGSNIDEFFMVRVSGLLEQTDAGIVDVGRTNESRSAISHIRREVKKLSSDVQKCLSDRLLPECGKREFRSLSMQIYVLNNAPFADSYFTEVIFPVLTPLAFDPGRPFPHISNLSVNLAVLIRDSKAWSLSRVSKVRIPCSNFSSTAGEELHALTVANENCKIDAQVRYVRKGGGRGRRPAASAPGK